MSNKVQFRRGTDAERGTVVLDSGEPGWTTDTKELYVGDGATYGGILVTGGAGGGAGTLCALSDVNCAGTVNGKVLTYQNGTWIAETPAGGGDMLISQYVTGAGTVYNATRLGGDPLATVQAHNVEASKITSGTIGLARIPSIDDARIPDLETLSYGGAFATGQIPNLPTSKITTGTFGLTRLPSITNTYLAGDITSDKISALSGTAIAYPLNADSVGTTAIKSAGVGNDELAGSGLDIAKFTVGTAGVARIPSLPTARITTGTFNLARIPAVDDARIPNLETLSYGGAFATGQIPNLAASKIASGTFGLARIPGTLTGKDADTVDGADAGVAANKVFKIPAGIAQGDIFHVDTSGNVVNLPAGASGNFLETLGPGTNPQWTTPGGGGDMLKSVYVEGVGTVYNASRLEGETLATVQAHNVDASKITSGTFGLARIPAVDDARIPNLETLSYGAAFATAQIPPIGAYKVASGTLAVARHETLDNLNGTVALTQIPTMDDAHIPDLGASKITSGTFNVNRIETLANLKGTVTEEKVASLPTSKITTGTFGLARIPSIDNDHLAGEITSDKISALSGTAIAYPLNADSVGTTAIKSAGVGNDELAGSGLDIAKCTVGTVGLARIPVIDDARIPDLETLSYGAAFATGQIPSLSASKTTTGTFNANRIPILPTDRYGSAVLVSGTRAMTGDLDFAKHQAKAIVLEVLGSHPASPATAQIYYNSGDDKVYIYVA